VGTDLRTSSVTSDIFITKINSNGTYAWTYTIGGGDPASDSSYGNSVKVDSTNNLYLTGFFTDSIGDGIDFDPTAGIDLKYNAASDGTEDIFILKLVGVLNTTTSVSSNNSSTLSSAPTCNDVKPVNAPNLFQIDVNATQAKLFYTPVTGDNSSYYIAYSEKLNTFQHSTQTDQGASTGVLSYTINLLKPNTTYYFKVRGQNGCTPGDWSNEMKIKTRGRGLTTKVSYYKNRSTSVGRTIKTIESTPTPTPPPVVQTSKPTETKKTCFLWWCW
jgi:hypothetical protein